MTCLQYFTTVLSPLHAEQIPSVDELFREAKDKLDPGFFRTIRGPKAGFLMDQFDKELRAYIKENSALQDSNELLALYRGHYRRGRQLSLWLFVSVLLLLFGLIQAFPIFSVQQYQITVIALVLLMATAAVVLYYRTGVPWCATRWRELRTTEQKLEDAQRKLAIVIRDGPPLALNSIRARYHLDDKPWRLTVSAYDDVHPCTYLVERHDDYKSTAVYRFIKSYIDTHDRGSIGIAGARGAGKTSLMRNLQRALAKERPRDVHTAWVSAPTQIEEREFLLSVLARLVISVGVRRTGNDYWPDPSPETRIRVRRYTRLAVVVVLSAVFWFLASRTNLYSVVRDRLDLALPTALNWQYTSWDLLTTLIVVGAIWLALQWLLRRRDTTGRDSTDGRILLGAGQTLLEELWYERKQTLTSGLTLFPASGHVSTERKRQPFTLPHLIDLWAQFVRLLTKHHCKKVVVFVDEVDKLKSNEKIEECMRILKALYEPDNLMFVVSISEDAYIEFQKGTLGQENRNAFDSSIDHWQVVEGIRCEELRTLINSRMLGHPFSIPVIQLIWMLSRGNPRDAIRLARRIPKDKRTRKLTDVALELCAKEASALAELYRLSDDGSKTIESAFRKLFNFSMDVERELSVSDRVRFSEGLNDALDEMRRSTETPLLAVQLEYVESIWRHFDGNDDLVLARCRRLNDRNECQASVERIHAHLTSGNAAAVGEHLDDYFRAIDQSESR